jgi:Transposase
MFAGIDWASEEHAVCVHDDAGRNKAAWAIAHSADGFEDLVRRLGRFGDPAELPVAIERPDGRLVDRLLEAGTRWFRSRRMPSRPGARRR